MSQRQIIAQNVIPAKSELKHKSPLSVSFVLLGIILAISLTVAVGTSLALEPLSPEGQQCSARLFGTMSQADCQKICPEGTEYGCLKVPGISENTEGGLECYTCARDQYCGDLGFLSLWDCWPCDANPKTECVKAGLAPGPFGLGGAPGGTPAAGQTWSGEQCYQCQAKPDRCAAKWPGSSWLAACQNNCKGKNKKCTFVGVHEMNDCYKCQEIPEQCGDLGLLTDAQCAPCNADPKTQCVPWGMTNKMEPCFKCVPKGLPPPPVLPPPPKEKSCASEGYAVSAAVCRGQGMDWRLVDVPGIPEKCMECIPKKKESCTPNLTKEECRQNCEAVGGRCLAMTRTKEGPECYSCYWGQREKQGCAYYDMPEGCLPNPCFEGETCQMVPRPVGLYCAACNPVEYIEDPACSQHELFAHCGYCYNAGMSCERVQLKDPPLECVKCLAPEDERCPEGTAAGTCLPASCPSSEECVNVDGCHRCQPKQISEAKPSDATAIGDPWNIFSENGILFHLGYSFKSGFDLANYPGILESQPQETSCPVGEFPGFQIKDSINWEKMVPAAASLVTLNRTLAELAEEKRTLQEQIVSMENAIRKREVQSNPELREMMENTLANARVRLSEVDEETAALSSQRALRLQEEEWDDEDEDFGPRPPWLRIRLPLNYGGGMTQIDPPAAPGDVFNQKGYLSDEAPGEILGLGGPLIVRGMKGKEPALGFFDSFGLPVGYVTKDAARALPELTYGLLRESDHFSRKNFFGEFAPQYFEGFRNYQRYRGEWSGDFVPQSVFMPQLGLNVTDTALLAFGFNRQLISGVKPEDFFAPYRCCSGYYGDEPIYDRAVLKKPLAEKEQIHPNDPLYFDPAAAKKSIKAKAPKIIIGTAMKFGDAILGGGSSEDTTAQGPEVKDQWGIRAVGFLPQSDPESAWNIRDGREKNVIVAVIDSGLDINHPDGPKYLWKNPGEIADNGQDDDQNGYVDDVHGWNFLKANPDVTDERGHGTNVAGIIAAQADNDLGIAGINPGAQIMALKVADKKGRTNSLNIFRAIMYAVRHQARVINISLGAKGISRLERLALNYAARKGVVVVVAAGNDGAFIPEYGPAALKHVLTVGALDFEGDRSTISNWGPNLSLLAPGEQIYTLHSKDAEWDGPSMVKDRRFTKVSGTSFAAPMVTATVSLLLANHPEWTPREVEARLLATARDMKEAGWDGLSGAGVLNAAAALKETPSAERSARMTQLKINYDKGKLISVDVFGTVAGDLQSFTVEVGKGQRPSKWLPVSAPATQPAFYNWLCRIDAKTFKGTVDDWQIRLQVIYKDGSVATAQTPMSLAAKKKVYDLEKE